MDLPTFALIIFLVILLVAYIIFIYFRIRRKCNLCGKSMRFEDGVIHKACSDYEAFMADRP